MAGKPKPVVNIADLTLESWSRGTKYASAKAHFGAALGMKSMGASYTEVPPGKSNCPFHNHHTEDEMFFVLEGLGEYRFGDEVHAIRAGDILAAPAGGPEVAHQILNTGTGPLRYLGMSNKVLTDIVEYPDSGKFLAVRRNDENTADRFLHIGKPRPVVNWDDTYFEGEPGA
jgi:uncharacterized cupin superfamily protein